MGSRELGRLVLAVLLEGMHFKRICSTLYDGLLLQLNVVPCHAVPSSQCEREDGGKGNTRGRQVESRRLCL